MCGDPDLFGSVQRADTCGIGEHSNYVLSYVGVINKGLQVCSRTRCENCYVDFKSSGNDAAAV